MAGRTSSGRGTERRSDRAPGTTSRIRDVAYAALVLVVGIAVLGLL